jgi:GTPase Era involved in 16S rRNA processing
MYKVKQFFRNIHNLIRWFPIIWKDRDWDDYFIFEILKFKLKNQAKYIGNKDRHVSAKRDAEKIMLCVRLIEKVQDEYYGCEYQDYCEIDVKFVESKSYPDMHEVEIETLSEHYDDYFKKYPRIYNQVKTEDKYKTVLNIARINEERAHKLLFKILEQNIRRWWD